MMGTNRIGFGFLTAAALVFALHAPAEAQDSRWLPFVGCWEPADAGEEAGLLCFRPEGAGVEMYNVLSGDVTSAERLVADGQPRPVSADGCSGTESVRFSEDGMRAFTTSDFVCDGDPRAGSGIMSFIARNQWIDVRSLEIDGEPVAWVQRYVLAGPDAMDEHGADDPAASNRTPIRAARIRAARDIELADVEEAVAAVESRAVEVWVATNETELALTGDELVRLADAGVPESLIDVMVAVSYPSRFVLSPEGAAEEAVAMGRVPGDGYRGGYRGFRSFLWDPLYSPIGYRYSPFGYSPFGYYGSRYGFGGGFGGYYGYTPVRVIVQPRPETGGGRMVRGQGYTRGGSGSSGVGARPNFGRTGGDSSASPSRGGDGGGGGARSSGGSGRTAQPRGNR